MLKKLLTSPAVRRTGYPLALPVVHPDARVGASVAPDALAGASAGPDALAQFLASSRPWRNQPVPLSRRVTTALWSLVGADAAVGAWLFAVLHDRSRCSGPLCSTATLGGHPAIALGLSIGCCVVLLVLAALTRGLTRAGAWHLVAVSVASSAGLIAVAGPLMVLALVALALVVLIAVLLAVTAST